MTIDNIILYVHLFLALSILLSALFINLVAINSEKIRRWAKKNDSPIGELFVVFYVMFTLIFVLLGSLFTGSVKSYIIFIALLILIPTGLVTMFWAANFVSKKIDGEN